MVTLVHSTIIPEQMAVSAGTRFVCRYGKIELSIGKKIDNNINGCTGKRWSLGVNNNNYGGVGKLSNLREFFLSRLANVSIGRSAQKINTNIYGCTGKPWSLGVNTNNYEGIGNLWSLSEFREAVDLGCGYQ
jgi:hypothetical protein